MTSDAKRVFRILALLHVISSAAYAQGSIAGVVRDTSGAVLPGVTVEASSPALIEKVRSVVTDATGQYKIVDIRPGTYSVSFTLVGFAVVKREGIEVSGTFTATVNAELRIGEVRETVTVTGESPTVDTHNVTQQRVLDSTVLEKIPLGRSYSDVAVVVPGLSTGRMDVGGTNNLQTATSSGFFSIHGTRTGDLRVLVDGAQTRHLGATGASSNYIPDMGSTQEVVIDYAAGSAEMATGGVRINLIPRDGGNIFSGSLFGTGVSPAFQGNNFSQDLKDQGLTGVNRLKLQYDINPAAGGPILQDKLWLFESARWQTNQNYVAGLYQNLNAGNPATYLYAADYSRQAVALLNNDNVSTRLTWQPTPRNKFSFSFDNQWRLWNYVIPGTSPEADNMYTFPRSWLANATWTAPLTSRLLLDVRYSDHAEEFRDNGPSLGLGLIPVVEQSTGLLYRGRCANGILSGGSGGCLSMLQPNINDVRASVSYVTGAHAFKVGFTELVGRLDNAYTSVGASNISYRFNNGVPNQIQEYAGPYDAINTLNDVALYAQDNWTVRRLSLSGGLRFDYFAANFPAYDLGPTVNLPARNLTFPQSPGANYKDLSPRIGAAYDLFGDGKTAVKASVGKYELGVVGTVGTPVLNQALSVTRSWTDANHNFVPDCNLANPLQNGECGTISDLTFGGTKPSTVIDPATLSGWGARPYNWEFSTTVQRELTSRVSANIGYFRRWFGNFTVTDNQAVAPTDFSPYTVTAPVDPRLPGGGGYVVGGLYNLNPNKVGQVSNYQTFASNYGSQTEHWNGFDFTLNARPRDGILLQGGLSTGRTTTDDCAIVDRYLNEVTVSTTLGTAASVQSTQMCHLQTPFLTQVKLLGTYPIPKVGVQISATFQSLPGPQIAANYTATNAQVQPSLGRPLSGGAANVTVNIVQPGTAYGQQANELDLRFEKILKFRRTRTFLDFDLYNVANASPVLTLNNSYGAWLTPLSILDARLFRIGVRFEF